MPYSKLYILTELSANDVKFISVGRKKLSLSIYIYTYGTVNSIFVEIQPDSTYIKMTLVYSSLSIKFNWPGEEQIIERKLVNIFLPISNNKSFGCSKEPFH